MKWHTINEPVILVQNLTHKVDWIERKKWVKSKHISVAFELLSTSSFLSYIWTKTDLFPSEPTKACKAGIRVLRAEVGQSG